MEFFPAGEPCIHAEHVMHHVAVADRARAAGIVTGHAADGGLRRSRYVDREPEIMRSQAGVEMIEHQAGLYRGLTLVGVDADDFAEVFRTIDDQRCADGLSALGRSRATRQDRHAFFRGDLQRDTRGLLVSRNNYADGLDLVDGRVGGITATRECIEQHGAFEVSPQPAFDRAPAPPVRAKPNGYCGSVHAELEFHVRRCCDDNLRPCPACLLRPGIFSRLNVFARRSPMTLRSGRHFLQIPGPTNVPDRVLRAMDRPTIDHRGPEFAQLGREVLEGIKVVFRTGSPVVIYPASGTGAWEAALVNTDRKSTRLNSSHQIISYAVFCLKKKKSE